MVGIFFLTAANLLVYICSCKYKQASKTCNFRS